MKKIISLAAAVMTAASAIPYCPKAAEEMNVKNIPHLTYYYPLEAEQETMDYISSRNLDIDFNSDGKFDHLDCYLLDRYDDYPGNNDYLPEDIREKIIANSDLDGDGETDAGEKLRIYCHFLLYCDIDTSFFAQSTYDAYNKELGIPNGPSYNSNRFSMNFVDSLNDRSIYLRVHYLFLEKMIEEGKVDPDVNNDGQFDMSDVVDFTIASTSEPWIGEQDPDTGLWSYKCRPDKKIVLDDEIKERAKKITLEQSDYPFIQEYDPSALLDCLFLREDVLPEYSDNTYYEKYYENAQYYEIGDMVENYREYIKQDSNFQPMVDELAKQEQEKEETKKRFYDEIGSGKAAAPDLNFDNIIDGRDLYIAELYHGDRAFGRTAEESSLTKEEYDFISRNCDYDHNGISGDDGDFSLILDYICKVVDERTTAMATDSTGEFIKPYADALFLKEMDPDGKPNSSYDPFHLYDDSGEKYEFPTLEDHYENYLRGLAMKMKVRPDIDGNGTVDELDKKYAESYAAYLETGKMGDTEIPDDVMERIKTECDFTGDGKSGLLYDMQVAALYIDRVVLKNGAQSEPLLEPKGKRSGDANCDDELSMADSVIIMQSLANPDRFGINGTDENHITEQGIENADIAGDNDGITTTDALAVQLILLGLDHTKYC
ncbi:hypothetical protein [Ruminococcus flavefaciens]|uniref:hypothetical protein n=1 Tax=Ruminococcus flavefaciens TaxID=1265 RepID=UPI0026F2FDF7|nr:hypothetical protein [Ruminococcus flavefaciens]